MHVEPDGDDRDDRRADPRRRGPAAAGSAAAGPAATPPPRPTSSAATTARQRDQQPGRYRGRGRAVNGRHGRDREDRGQRQPDRLGQVEAGVRMVRSGCRAWPARAAARNPALVRKASETRNSRASVCRRAAALIRTPSTTLTAATTSTSQKWLGWCCHRQRRRAAGRAAATARPPAGPGAAPTRGPGRAGRRGAGGARSRRTFNEPLDELMADGDQDSWMGPDHHR